jgi:hypothetical protein
MPEYYSDKPIKESLTTTEMDTNCSSLAEIGRRLGISIYDLQQETDIRPSELKRIITSLAGDCEGLAKKIWAGYFLRSREHELELGKITE